MALEKAPVSTMALTGKVKCMVTEKREMRGLSERMLVEELVKRLGVETGLCGLPGVLVLCGVMAKRHRSHFMFAASLG